MSFGVGVGDLITVGQLAWALFNQAKDAPADFSGVADEALTLHAVIENVKEHSQLNRINEQSAIRRPLEALNKVLKELLQLLDKHKSLASSDKKLKDRMQWSGDRVKDLRSQLTSQTSMLEALISAKTNEELAIITESIQQLHTTTSSNTNNLASTLETGFSNIEASFSNIESKLERALQTFQARQSRSSLTTAITETTSIASFYTAESINIDERLVWRALRQDFAEQGITTNDFDRHRDSIMDWLKAKALDNRLDDSFTEMVIYEPLESGSISRRESFETMTTQLENSVKVPTLIIPALPLQPEHQSVKSLERNDESDVFITMEMFNELAAKESNTIRQAVVRELIRRVDDSPFKNLKPVELSHRLRYKKLLQCDATVLLALLMRWDIDGQTVISSRSKFINEVLTTLKLISGTQPSALVSKLVSGSISSWSWENRRDFVLGAVAAYTANVEIVREIINSGASVNVRDEHGGTTLHGASSLAYAHVLRMGERAEVVQLLLQSGADCNARTDLGLTALHCALGSHFVLRDQDKHLGPWIRNEKSEGFKEFYKVVETLLKYEIDVNAQTLDGGLSALHLASVDGWFSLVKLLLEFDADTKLRDKKGRTALMLAQMNRHQDVVEVLENHERRKETFSDGTSHENVQPVSSQGPAEWVPPFIYFLIIAV